MKRKFTAIQDSSTCFSGLERRRMGRREIGERHSVHLMPQCCLARLPFVAESAGQRRKADTKNRQDSLQDTLCAITTHRRQDKAIGCLDTSLTRILQLSHGTGLTAVLLLGLAYRYSGASAMEKYTQTPCGSVQH